MERLPRADILHRVELDLLEADDLAIDADIAMNAARARKSARSRTLPASSPACSRWHRCSSRNPRAGRTLCARRNRSAPPDTGAPRGDRWLSHASVVSAMGNDTSAITLCSPVISITTKLSLLTARRLTASAGYVSDVQCQAPAGVVQEAGLFEKPAQLARYRAVRTFRRREWAARTPRTSDG